MLPPPRLRSGASFVTHRTRSAVSLWRAMLTSESYGRRRDLRAFAARQEDLVRTQEAVDELRGERRRTTAPPCCLRDILHQRGTLLVEVVGGGHELRSAGSNRSDGIGQQVPSLGQLATRTGRPRSQRPVPDRKLIDRQLKAGLTVSRDDHGLHHRTPSRVMVRVRVPPRMCENLTRAFLDEELGNSI